MDPTLTYWAMVAAFATHELDAVRRREWRVLPLTRFLPDRVGEEVFVWAHLPLLLLVLVFSDAEGFRIGLAAFAVVHVGLHWLFRRHPANEFNNPSSWALILLTGALGGIYISRA
jgi:hypothetical protein